jgi:hypothetical protein
MVRTDLRELRIGACRAFIATCGELTVVIVSTFADDKHEHHEKIRI